MKAWALIGSIVNVPLDSIQLATSFKYQEEEDCGNSHHIHVLFMYYLIGVAMRIVNKRVFYFGNVFGLTLGILFVMNIRSVSHDDLQPGMRFINFYPMLLLMH